MRRAFALGVLAAFVLLLILLGARARSPLVPWMLALPLIWLGWRLYQATQGGLRLTETGLETLSGQMIAPIDSIKAVDRGALAFKPSGGFLLSLNAPVQRKWAPGLYWALGRKIGVGGVTDARAARAMAEAIALRVGREG